MISDYIRLLFWFFIGALCGMFIGITVANADEHWSNYPRLPATEMWIGADSSWVLHFGHKWDPTHRYVPYIIASGQWGNWADGINICGDSIITKQVLSPEIRIRGDDYISITDTLLNSHEVNIGVQWSLEESLLVTGPWDTLDTGRRIDMIVGAVQLVIGVRPDGFCAHRVVRFYLQPHADRLTYTQGE